ncbi:XrtV sorting system accessory protein [Hyphococcus lacteus]|uniref:XrtV sorting system accessory protein n=1 Tax=Hyphococcus lacteus TaxID=3143536 RepID=A0ABV3Z247_9PROT
MFSIFDLFSLALLLASMALFVSRYMVQDPPVYPYLIIATTCLVANWLGNAGGGIFAMVLLIAAAFSFLGCLLYPSWRTMSSDDQNTGTTPQSAEK